LTSPFFLREDAKLLRRIAKALAGGGEQAEVVRRIIDESVKKPISFEEWVAEPSEE
jgi:hypothetical protein